MKLPEAGSITLFIVMILPPQNWRGKIRKQDNLEIERGRRSPHAQEPCQEGGFLLIRIKVSVFFPLFICYLSLTPFHIQSYDYLLSCQLLTIVYYFFIVSCSLRSLDYHHYMYQYQIWVIQSLTIGSATPTYCFIISGNIV